MKQRLMAKLYLGAVTHRGQPRLDTLSYDTGGLANADAGVVKPIEAGRYGVTAKVTLKDPRCLEAPTLYVNDFAALALPRVPSTVMLVTGHVVFYLRTTLQLEAGDRLSVDLPLQDVVAGPKNTFVAVETHPSILSRCAAGE